ncbi:MAG: hypothetical protein F4X99_11950 [Gammaproteobacteria bacterium]|nr:hypothetical protein [Gammaproteobacteria bacterium]
MNVLVIPEDFRKDQYLLKPLFRRLLRELGRPNAHVAVCQDPLLGGVAEALNSARVADVVARYDGMTDVFILCVDRDGQVGRRERLDLLEQEFDDGRVFIAENAWEELETWTLAGLNLPSEWLWSEVRAEVSVKERYFDVLAKRRGVSDSPGGGRKPLGEEASPRISAIRQKCPDFDNLARRLQRVLANA